jgi:hypothetical protein
MTTDFDAGNEKSHELYRDFYAVGVTGVEPVTLCL